MPVVSISQQLLVRTTEMRAPAADDLAEDDASAPPSPDDLATRLACPAICLMTALEPPALAVDIAIVGHRVPAEVDAFAEHGQCLYIELFQ